MPAGRFCALQIKPTLLLFSFCDIQNMVGSLWASTLISKHASRQIVKCAMHSPVTCVSDRFGVLRQNLSDNRNLVSTLFLDLQCGGEPYHTYTPRMLIGIAPIYNARRYGPTSTEHDHILRISHVTDSGCGCRNDSLSPI